MTHDEFFSAVKRGEIARAYLFAGEEEHVKAKALEALSRRVLPEGLEAMNETLLTNPSAEEIIAAAETLPMMAERRLIVVRDSALLTSGKAAGEAEDSARLAEYLRDVPETTCLVFYCRGVPDRRKKLAVALAKEGVEVRFDRLDDRTLLRWIASTAKGYGKAITEGNASLLAFTAGHDLLVLGQEIAKLAAYSGERGEIGREEIEAVVTPSLEANVFQMVDALVAGKEADAFAKLGVMLEHGEARIGILAMIARQYRNLLHLALMQAEGVAEGEIQKRLGVAPFALRKLYAQVRKENAEGLREKLALCVDTDWAIKSGKMREDLALERAILRLCA